MCNRQLGFINFDSLYIVYITELFIEETIACFHFHFHQSINAMTVVCYIGYRLLLSGIIWVGELSWFSLWIKRHIIIIYIIYLCYCFPLSADWRFFTIPSFFHCLLEFLFLIALSHFPLISFHFGLTYVFYSVLLSFPSDSSLHSLSLCRSLPLSFILIITCSSLNHSLYANFSRFKRTWFIETVKIIPLSPPPSSPFPLLSPSVHSAGPLICFPLIRVRLSLPRRLGRLCKLRKLLKIQVFLFVFRFSLFVFRLAFGKYSLTANARRTSGGERRWSW